MELESPRRHNRPLTGPRSSEEFVLLTLGLAGGIAVFPFLILRLLSQQWLIAAFDIIICSLMLAISGYVFFKRRVYLASIALSVLSVCGAVFTVYLKGSEQVFWLYPAMLAAFYLLDPHKALLLNTAGILLAMGKLYTEMPLFDLLALAVTFTISYFFAYVFARNTQRQNDQLRLLVNQDALTGAGNRRAMDAKLKDVMALQKRYPTTVSLILFDLDHFKQVNDQFGHAIGDAMLKQVSEIIKSRIRETDSLYRMGGEEFVVVPLEIDIEGAVKLAEELRELVFTHAKLNQSSVTISLGVAEYIEGETAEHWLARADEALYRAKRAGRNQTCIAA